MICVLRSQKSVEKRSLREWSTGEEEFCSCRSPSRETSQGVP